MAITREALQQEVASWSVSMSMPKSKPETEMEMQRNGYERNTRRALVEVDGRRMMQRFGSCEHCGIEFPCASKRARFCGSTCRSRAHRAMGLRKPRGDA